MANLHASLRVSIMLRPCKWATTEIEHVKMKLGIDRKQSGKHANAVHWMEGGYAESV